MKENKIKNVINEELKLNSGDDESDETGETNSTNKADLMNMMKKIK